MNTGLNLILQYAPIVHFDRNEPLHPRAVGYSVFRETRRSLSFPNRSVDVPEGASLVIEYAYYYDYDIEHMYDLEHIWVTIAVDGSVMGAQGSFHGKYLNLTAQIPGAVAPTGTHIHAFCQPGKHAFLAAGELTRLYPGWDMCCGNMAGGPVLIGGPFSAAHSPTGRDLYVPSALDDAHSIRYLKEVLAFTPSLEFVENRPDDSVYMPWETLYALIPGWIHDECRRLDNMYGKE